MRKFLMSALLIFALIIGQEMQAEADELVRWHCHFCKLNIEVPSTVYPNDGWRYKADCPPRLESLRAQVPGGADTFKVIYQDYPEYRQHFWERGEYIEPPPKTPAQIEAERREAEERAARLKREAEERKAQIQAEIERRIRIREESQETIAQADAIFKTKNYTASTEAYSQAISIDPYNGYTHYMLAKSLYRDKTNKNKNYDLILEEIAKAISNADSLESLADYYDYMAKVTLKLGWKNLFNSDCKVDYTAICGQCQEMSRNIRAKIQQQNQNQLLGGLFK